MFQWPLKDQSKRLSFQRLFWEYPHSPDSRQMSVYLKFVSYLQLAHRIQGLYKVLSPSTYLGAECPCPPFIPIGTKPRYDHLSNPFHNEHQVSPVLVAKFHANIPLRRVTENRISQLAWKKRKSKQNNSNRSVKHDKVTQKYDITITHDMTHHLPISLKGDKELQKMAEMSENEFEVVLFKITSDHTEEPNKQLQELRNFIQDLDKTGA